MHLFALVRIVHVAIGVVAFASMPVPLFGKKGSKRHVSFGRVFAYAMGALAVTGVPLAARGLSLGHPRRSAMALFLFFIAMLAAESAWMGIRALRVTPTGGPRLLDRAAPAVLLAAAIGIGVLGLARGIVILGFFGGLGALLAVGQLARWRRGPQTRAEAVRMHIGGMGVACITTITAFLVTNARYVFHLGAFNAFVWITPAVVGGIAIGLAQRGVDAPSK